MSAAAHSSACSAGFSGRAAVEHRRSPIHFEEEDRRDHRHTFDRRRRERPTDLGEGAAPAAGIALVVGFVVALNSPAVEDAGNTPAEVVATASDHHTWAIVGMVFGLAAVALAGAFVAGLHARLQHLATSGESSLILVGGIVFTVCFPLALFLFQAPLVDMPADHARALVEAEAYLSYDDAAWVMFAAAGLGAALMAIPASLAAIRAGVPTWLGWLGVLAGVLSAGTIVFFGMFAWMAWILVASIVLLVARDA